MTMTRVEPSVTAPSNARAHFAASNAIAEEFFGNHADDIARACQSMAARFQKDGRLLVCGEGAQRSDVAHVVVEFLHPVVVGKRALPAIALPGVSARDAATHFETFARAEDILLVLCAGTLDVLLSELVAAAAVRGVLTVVLSGDGDEVRAADHAFAVPSSNACIVQETHEMLYHILWELTHVFLDHRGSEA